VKLSEELYVKSGNQYRFPLDHQSLLQTSSLQQINRFLRQTNDQFYPVLLLGESGVGKEAFAKMIQQNSKRSGTFLAFNCSTLPNGLIESELFGYQGGLFGGQAEESPGKLDLASNGAIYLMNIQTLPLSTQTKLVTAIREKQYFRVGGSQPVPLKCQIVASASPDLEAMVENGQFMRDLFYSFYVQSIPPLRDRREELPELCHLFLTESAKVMGKPVPKLSSEVMAALTTYSWPGNFPQMRNLMERLVLLSDDKELTLSDLPPELQLKTLSGLAEDSLSLTSLSEEMEKTKIEDVLKRTGGNKSSAARLLGISRGSLYYKIKQYGIREDEHA
jgi:DNA-binding NtrC family response regulator